MAVWMAAELPPGIVAITEVLEGIVVRHPSSSAEMKQISGSSS
jgi:hypothetical protein